MKKYIKYIIYGRYILLNCVYKNQVEYFCPISDSIVMNFESFND